MIKGMICMVLWNQGGNLEGILAGGHNVLGKKKKTQDKSFFYHFSCLGRYLLHPENNHAP